MTNPTPHGQVPAITRYKICYHADEWGVRSLSPIGIYDDAGPWVRYEDHVTALAAGQATAAPAQPAAQQGAAYAALPEPLSKRPSEANTLVWVADPISSTGVRGVFVDDITCLWWWGAGLIFQKEVDASALALRMRSAIAPHGQASSQAGEYPALVCDYCGAREKARTELLNSLRSLQPKDPS